MMKAILHNKPHIFQTYTTTKKSVVYMVKSDDNPQKYVCKKVCIKENDVDAKREIAALSMLQNTSKVVKLEDYYNDGEFFYLLLEYCSGGNLLKLENEPYIDDAELSKVLRKCLLCILECHRLNIIHGDIKLNNFVVSGTGETKLIDFGCSAIIEDVDQCVDFKTGTPFYLSPENIEGKQCLNSDMWGLGVAGFYLITKNHPFSNVTFLSESLWNNILHNDLNVDMIKSRSAECVDFFKRVLNKDPEERLTVLQALNHPFIDSFV